MPGPIELLRDQALADLAWERSEGGQLVAHGKGFLSGLTNPFGTVGYGLEVATRRLPAGSASRRIAQGHGDMMRQWEDASPYANTAGSMVAGGRGLASMLGLDRRNLAHLLGILTSASPVVRNVQDVFTGDGERRKEMQRGREYGAAGY